MSQQFSRNVQSAQREINQVKDKLTEQFKAGTISQVAYEAELSKWETVSLGLSMVAGGLTAPTSSALGIVAATISPAVAVAGGNSALVGATSALTAEATAPVLAQFLFNKGSAQLTAEEKHTIQAIANLAGASTGSYASISQGGQSASNAVGNNYLVPDVSSWGGVKHWGTGAASLVNTSIQQGKTIEQINEELSAYTRGEGFDNGMTDGLIMMGVAPAAMTLGAPYAVGYVKLAGSAIGTSVAINAVTGKDYTVSDMLADLTAGALNNASVNFLRKQAQIQVNATKGNIEKIEERFLNTQGFIQGTIVGAGISGGIGYYLNNDNKSLLKTSEWIPNILKRLEK